jgi:predicted kinase
MLGVMVPLYVLVGGWPGSGKTTTARALAPKLGLAYLGKDDLKQSLMDQFGTPDTVPASRRLGEAAVRILLRLARDCPGAVIDSTWFDYSRPLVDDLPGVKVEVRCVVPIDVARARYADRRRDVRHLDHLREFDELWGRPVAPLGAGPVLTQRTDQPVPIGDLARRVLAAAAARG